MVYVGVYRQIPIWIDEFASKVMEGLKRANRKLVENAALNDESLIVGDDNGGLKLSLQKSC